MDSAEALMTDSSGAVPDRMRGSRRLRRRSSRWHTWQEERHVRWAFRHMREIMPRQAIPADRHTTRALDAASTPSVLGASVTRLDGTRATVEAVFVSTWTDALPILHEGKVVD